jgi:hypothetical protein
MILSKIELLLIFFYVFAENGRTIELTARLVRLANADSCNPDVSVENK